MSTQFSRKFSAFCKASPPINFANLEIGFHLKIESYLRIYFWQYFWGSVSSTLKKNLWVSILFLKTLILHKFPLALLILFPFYEEKCLNKYLIEGLMGMSIASDSMKQCVLEGKVYYCLYVITVNTLILLYFTTKFNCNWTRTHIHLVRKRTRNHLAKLAKWLSWVVSTYLYGVFDCMLLSCHVRVSERNPQISRLFRAWSSLTFRQLQSVDSLWNAY